MKRLYLWILGLLVISSVQAAGKSVLLTGATGFVGSHVLERLLREDRYSDIYVVVRDRTRLDRLLLSFGYHTLPPRLRVFKGSGPDWPFMYVKVDHVIHTAGAISGRRRSDFIETNVTATTQLFDRLIAPERIVVLSSRAAGAPSEPTEPFTQEGAEDAPVNWYGESKLEMEGALQRDYAHLNYLVLRPPMIFGRNDSNTRMLLETAKGPVIPLPGWWKKRYSFIAVEDLVDAIMTVMASDNDLREIPHRYLYVASEETITSTEMFSIARSVVEGKGVLFPIANWCTWLVSHAIRIHPPTRDKLPNLGPGRLAETKYSWVNTSDSFARVFNGWRAKTGYRAALERAHADLK